VPIPACPSPKYRSPTTGRAAHARSSRRYIQATASIISAWQTVTMRCQAAAPLAAMTTHHMSVISTRVGQSLGVQANCPSSWWWVALVVRWARQDRRTATRTDRHADADADLKAYDAMLRELAKNRC
jgi:hypothetical protein